MKHTKPQSNTDPRPATTEAAMIDPVRVAQTEARIRADEEAGTIAVMEPYDAVMTQIDYLAAVAEYAARGEDEELQQGLDGLRLLVERLAFRLAAAAPPSGQVSLPVADLRRLHEGFTAVGNREDSALWYRVRDLIDAAQKGADHA